MHNTFSIATTPFQPFLTSRLPYHLSQSLSCSFLLWDVTASQQSVLLLFPLQRLCMKLAINGSINTQPEMQLLNKLNGMSVNITNRWKDNGQSMDSHHHDCNKMMNLYLMGIQTNDLAFLLFAWINNKTKQVKWALKFRLNKMKP